MISYVDADAFRKAERAKALLAESRRLNAIAMEQRLDAAAIVNDLYENHGAESMREVADMIEETANVAHNLFYQHQQNQPDRHWA